MNIKSIKGIVSRSPENKKQSIPFLFLQVAGLDQSRQLAFHARKGFILAGRPDMTAGEAVDAVTHLYQLADSLILQLVDASARVTEKPDAHPDPLGCVDADVLDALIVSGADPDGLRMLLAMEDEEFEE